MIQAKLLSTLPKKQPVNLSTGQVVPGGEEEGHGVAAKGRVRQRGEVAADAEVHRLALPQCRGNCRVDLLVRVVQIGHHRLNP